MIYYAHKQEGKESQTVLNIANVYPKDETRGKLRCIFHELQKMVENKQQSNI